MIRNIIALVLSFVLIVSIISSKVFALKEIKLTEYLVNNIEKNIEKNFEDNVSIDDFRDKFNDKFKVFDAKREENISLNQANRELNNLIKDKLQVAKEKISHEVWKEIRSYKSLINDMKISTGEKVKKLISTEKEDLHISNYSDESVEKFINALIKAQKLKRESIDFEKNYLHKIDNLI